MLVDEIGDVVEVEDDAFEPPPETLRGKVRGVILGVYKLSGKLMHVLDTAKACQIAETRLSDGGAGKLTKRFDLPVNARGSIGTEGN